MVRNFGILISLSLLLISNLAMAVAPNAGNWATSHQNSRVISNVVFVSELPAGRTPKFLGTVTIENQRGFLNIVSSKSAEMTVKLNDYNPPKTTNRSKHIKELKRLLGVDKVIFAPKNSAKWSLYTFKNGRVQLAGSLAKPTTVNMTSLSTWMAKLLNYQGVVVASKSGYLLVAAYNNLFDSKTQGVILKNSVTEEILSSFSVSGSSIIELANSSNNFGVYKVILGEKKVPIGSKIQFY